MMRDLSLVVDFGGEPRLELLERFAAVRDLVLLALVHLGVAGLVNTASQRWKEGLTSVQLGYTQRLDPILHTG